MKRLVIALLLLAGCASNRTVVDRVPRDLWPGFDPRTIPVAIYDGTNTHFYRHPTAPAVVRGRHAAITANSSAKILGVETATVANRDAAMPLVAHEMFHVYQRTHHPQWTANEADLFLYPVTDVAVAQSLRLEEAALRRALNERDGRCWASAAMAFRAQRFARSDPAYERGTELNEGLATYVEYRAERRPDAKIWPDTPFAPDKVRDRAYKSGATIGHLLDRYSPQWRAQLERETTPLDELLRNAVASTPPCTLENRDAIERDAAAAVAAIAGQRASHRNELLTKQGFRIVIISDASPLLPTGFDPLNVELVTPTEILHRRFVKLGNDNTSIEILGHASLTTAAGKHPLFNGVRRVEITGFATEPQVREDGFDIDGAKATYKNATIAREGESIIVTLR
jgi:hypothetical protein